MNHSHNIVSFLDQDSETLRNWLFDHKLMDMMTSYIRQPLLPLPDNFTAPARTPWGGTKILGKYKQHLAIREERRYPVVGESWEVSADPIVPCHFIFDFLNECILIDFIQLIDLFPEHVLGRKMAAKFENQNPLLVKLLDAADHLSVQVHPGDDYSGLQPHESGKPECWYVVEAEPGGGLYLGLQEHVSKDQLSSAIEHHKDVAQYLNFVEVQSGDFFVIDAGTIHAIGAGVTLIEPQKIVPKKTGKTYRLWDWNRLYDPQGRQTMNGKSRELHVSDSLRIINFDDARGAEFVQHIQPAAQTIRQHGESTETLLVETDNFGVSRISLEDNKELPGTCSNGFHSIVVYDGVIEIYHQQQKVTDIPCGQSVILPAILQEYTLKSQHAIGLNVYYPAQHL